MHALPPDGQGWPDLDDFTRQLDNLDLSRAASLAERLARAVDALAALGVGRVRRPPRRADCLRIGDHHAQLRLGASR